MVDVSRENPAFTLPSDMAENAWYQPILVGDVNKSLEPAEGQSDFEFLDQQAARYTEDLSVFQQQAIRNAKALELSTSSGQTVDVRMIGLSLRPDGTWIVYLKDRSSYDSQVYKNKGAADAEASRLNEGESGNRYESYPSMESGEGGRYRVREKADYADRVDPDNPVEQEISLGNGQSIYILSNGRMVTGESNLNWDDWDEAANTHKIGNKEMVELPNGDIVEKSVDTKAGDVKIVETIPLEDGSRVAVFNDGSRQLIAGGKVSSVEIDEATGYVVSRDSQGNPTLRKPLYEPGIDYTDAGFNILSGPEGPITDLGLPETPATIETIGGQQFIRGTQGELEGLDGALDRAIDHAIITGQIDKARAWDDFRKRPDSLTVLEKAMEWAKTPGDQAFISKLHYMTSAQAAAAGEDALGQGAGVFNIAAQPSQFAQDAYQRFQDSITGGRMPTAEDFQASLAADSEPPAPTVREQLAIDLDQAKLDAALAKTEREEELHEAAMLSDKAESEARIQKLLKEEERAGIAFDNEQTRLQAASDFKLGKTATSTTTTNGSETPAANGEETPAANGEETPTQKAERLKREEEAEAERVRLEEEAEAERVRLELLNDDAAAKGLPRWVYSTRTNKYIYASAGFDISAQGEGLFYEASDPNAPDINLYDVGEDGTGSGELKTVSDPVTATGKGTVEDTFRAQRTDADGNMVYVDTGEYVNPEAAAKRNEALREIDDTGGVTFDDVPLSEDEVPWSQPATGAGVSAKDLAAAVAGQTPSGMVASESDPLPISTVASGTMGGSTIASDDYDEMIPTDANYVSSSPYTAESFYASSPDYRATGSGYVEKTPDPVVSFFANTIPNVAKGVGSWITDTGPTIGQLETAAAIRDTSPTQEDVFNMWARDYGEADGGITTGDKVTLVGESGPEIALFPNGTEIIPLDRDMKPDQKRRLRRRGVRGMQEGGLVFDREPSRGISQFLGGREVGPSQGRLFRRAGFTTPSAQALRNILPEELEEFRAMGARARIPEGTFERELAQGIASGTRSSNSARFLPLSLRS